MTTTEAPLGTGMQPANAIFYVNHHPDYSIRWHLDARGWATGYEVIKNAD